MALTTSNIHKYTIRHANEAVGTEVDIPVYPTSVTPSHNLVSKSWNNMWGEFQDIPVNKKVKIIWAYDVLSEDNMLAFYINQIDAKIELYKTRFFIINFYFPGRGYVKGKFYLGTPTTFKSLGGGENGKPNFWSGEIHWIEVDGLRLNSPT